MEYCLNNAQYAVDAFQKKGIDAWRNPHAITVVFPKPPPPILEDWQIAVKDDDAHIICMPHVTRELIDKLVNDISSAMKQETAV